MLVATPKRLAHGGTSTFPWGFGSRSAFRFPAVRARRPRRGRAARVCGARTQRPLIRSGQRGQLSALGLREKRLQEKRNCRLGPGATSAGRPRVRSCTSLASGGINAPSPPRFPILNYGPERIPPGLERDYADRRNMAKWKWEKPDE